MTLYALNNSVRTLLFEKQGAPTPLPRKQKPDTDRSNGEKQNCQVQAVTFHFSPRNISRHSRYEPLTIGGLVNRPTTFRFIHLRIFIRTSTSLSFFKSGRAARLSIRARPKKECTRCPWLETETCLRAGCVSHTAACSPLESFGQDDPEKTIHGAKLKFSSKILLRRPPFPSNGLPSPWPNSKSVYQSSRRQRPQNPYCA
jgi:hypothetical protein